ncbi:flagellar biosynthetic protein FliR [Sporobacter termitidis DSM 10068]|uniref:Flagellar biosynthetic protein FliR n=2 Tax=Sporobacter TaxID=44748 RepID=A0A1M5W881_9FIRM|nr:flagellar biosynthetic protein FliR [Sporobacter termitidis DSM 10068]
MSQLALIRDHLDYVLLLFVRVTGLLISSPIFGRKNVPNIAKIGFCAVLTVVFMSGLPAPASYPVFNNLLEYALVVVRELAFGVAMGFVLTAIFNLTMTAGAIMDYQIGYSMASIYDFQNNSQSPVSGNLFNIMMLILFFMYDGHLKLISVIQKTITAVPIGTAMAPPDILWVAAEVMTKSFLLSIMVAMPVLAAGVMIEIALGAMIKTVPQMNMFVVGIPIKIIVGLVVMLMTFSLFANFTKDIFTQMFNYIGVMFDHLAGTA